jgi:hypothetical protein
VKGWRGSAPWTNARFYTPRDLAALLQEAGARDLHTASAAYLPPAAPAWLRTRGASFERRARRLGSFGAAFSLARGVIGDGRASRLHRTGHRRQVNRRRPIG